MLYNGAWGFASSPTYTSEEVDNVVALAIRIARASAMALREGGVNWAPQEVLKLAFK